MNCLVCSISSGGAELLAGNVRVHKVELAKGLIRPSILLRQGNMKSLIAWVRDNVITERKELFVQGDSVYVECCFVLTDCSGGQEFLYS